MLKLREIDFVTASISDLQQRDFRPQYVIGVYLESLLGDCGRMAIFKQRGVWSQAIKVGLEGWSNDTSIIRRDSRKVDTQETQENSRVTCLGRL
jgi:hypothetical protein